MRIYAVTPIHVPDEELARRQARYDALCPPGLSVELHDIGAGAPRALDTEQQVRDSEGMVTEALRAAPDEADALLPDCVLDPGVPALAGTLGRPVFGLLRTSMTWSALAGRSVGAVTRNRPIADELARQVDVYGLGGSFTGVEVLDLDVDAIHQADRWGASLEAVVGRMGRAGAGDLVNGCSAVDLPAEAADWPVRVVDPTALALRLIAAGEAAA
ncbi:aspartate/glutamate racemase family protein [Blastococcus sp. SYSU DS0510]